MAGLRGESVVSKYEGFVYEWCCRRRGAVVKEGW